MPRVNIWLSEELQAEVKRSGLPVSRICQEALRRALSDPVPEEAQAQDSVAGIAEGLRDLGYRLNRELKRMAKVVEDEWEAQ